MVNITKGHVLKVNKAVTDDLQDQDVLVLDVGTMEDGKVTVTRGGLTHHMVVDRDTLLLPVSSPSPLTRRLAYSIAGAPKRFEELEQQRDGYAAEVTRANTKLADIRKWMISIHESGDLHRSDLDVFLDEFGFEPYSKRWTGTVTFTVDLAVDDADDLDDAKEKVHDWVNWCHVNQGSEISEVNVRALTYSLGKDRS